MAPSKANRADSQSPLLLAEELGHQAGAVVLSGADSDGAQGVEEIKAAGGITLAQEPTSAKFDCMPKKAIDTGCVDLFLTPKERIEADLPAATG
jgi:two-component system, chemotaxis family, CheB/CheR fusion protein